MKIEDVKIAHSIWYLEAAFSKEDYREESNNDISVAQDLVRAIPATESFIQVIEDDIEPMKLSQPEMDSLILRFDGFQEFDSHRWHGSGYFGVEVMTTDAAMALTLREKFDMAFNNG